MKLNFPARDELIKTRKGLYFSIFDKYSKTEFTLNIANKKYQYCRCFFKSMSKLMKS